jgi:hypothetical protein
MTSGDRADRFTDRRSMMPDPQEEPTPDSATLAGEIVALEENAIRVRLETGETGSLQRSDLPDPRLSLRPGMRARFRVGQRDAQAGLLLTWVSAVEDDSAVQPSFEREVDRLHNVLANRHPTNKRHHALADPLGEEKIQQWVKQTEESLARLRKHRAKRLNEEFYNG